MWYDGGVEILPFMSAEYILSDYENNQIGEYSQMKKILMTILMAVALSLGLISIEGCHDESKAEIDSIRQEMNTVTVKVTNSNGSISQVKLMKQDVGYVGPRGEYYDHLPTEDQLRIVYGF